MEISKRGICDSGLDNCSPESGADIYNLDCPRCGYYKITRAAYYDLLNLKEKEEKKSLRV